MAGYPKILYIVPDVLGKYSSAKRINQFLRSLIILKFGRKLVHILLFMSIVGLLTTICGGIERFTEVTLSGLKNFFVCWGIFLSITLPLQTYNSMMLNKNNALLIVVVNIISNWLTFY